MSNEDGQDALPETDLQPEAVESTEVEDATEAASEAEEESATSESDESAEDRPRKDKGVGKRINELTREKYEAKREAERLAAELAALRQQKQPEAKASADDPEPTLESCGWDPERFSRESARWEIRQELTRRENQYREAQKAKQAEADAESFRARVEELEKVSPGAWEKAVTAPINVTEPMAEVIKDSEVGPHIAAWLAENLDEADAISSMSPYQAAKMLGQIEAMIQGNLRAKPKVATTNAPPPPPKVKGSAPAVKSPEQMTMAEYVAWRSKTESKRR